jgi:hypothetical protein
VKHIPAYLTVFNRLTWPRALAADCERLGFEPVLVDNGSTYPPLLDWYQTCPYRVLRLGHNGGCYAFFNAQLHLRQGGLFVVSDPDLDLSRLPADTGDRLRAALRANPGFPKAGLSLEVEDLPDHYPFKRNVREHEAGFWERPSPDGNWVADVDTTFALYDPDRDFRRHFYKAIRLARPYTARHLPWYLDPKNLTDEERYFIDRCEGPSVWSTALKRYLAEARPGPVSAGAGAGERVKPVPGGRRRGRPRPPDQR